VTLRKFQLLRGLGIASVLIRKTHKTRDLSQG
jgi:hypothetical protein